MNHPVDVLVVGGGMVGLTAALAMAERHYSVAVIDAGTLNVNLTAQDSRVYALNKASRHLLNQLGVWQHLDKTRMSSYDKMHVWDGANGSSIDFNSRAIAAQDLGFIIEESVLKQALLKQIETKSTISLFPHSSVEEVKSFEEGVRISSQNSLWEGRLLMIADGANSPARHQLKVDVTTWPYHQQAIVATVHTQLPHQRTAWQVFHADGPLAFLPLSGTKQCSIVWSIESKRAEQLMGLTDEEFNAVLTQAFSKRLGDVLLASPRHQFPLHMRHVKQYVGSNWLLLGDAAHTIHPLAGLGLNIGLADVYSWMHCLDAVKGGFVSKKALGSYQRQRKHAVWQTILLMEGFKHLFGSSLAPVCALRGLGLRFCNEMTVLKRLFIQHAAG